MHIVFSYIDIENEQKIILFISPVPGFVYYFYHILSTIISHLRCYKFFLMAIFQGMTYDFGSSSWVLIKGDDDTCLTSV